MEPRFECIMLYDGVVAFRIRSKGWHTDECVVVDGRNLPESWSEDLFNEEESKSESYANNLTLVPLFDLEGLDEGIGAEMRPPFSEKWVLRALNNGFLGI